MLHSLTSPPSGPPTRGTWKKGVCRLSSWLGIVAALSLATTGCGRIVSQKATDQLIAGDAVDRSVAQIDFRILTGKKIFLDSQYVNKTVPGVGFVTSDYIVSSIRQKMMCDGCLLQEKMDEADFVVEMRIGALGADGHEVIYGMPPNNYMSIAASVVPTSTQAAAVLPSMPELSVGKRDDQMAAAKIALFAYNRRSREPIWQSGISESRSLVADRWFLGAGPFHKGNIYGTKKQPADPPLFGAMDEDDSSKQEYFVERRFADPAKSLADSPPPAKPAVAAAAPTPASGTLAAAATAAAAGSLAAAAGAPTAPAAGAAATPATGAPLAVTVAAPAAATPPSTTVTSAGQCDSSCYRARGRHQSGQYLDARSRSKQGGPGCAGACASHAAAANEDDCRADHDDASSRAGECANRARRGRPTGCVVGFALTVRRLRCRIAGFVAIARHDTFVAVVRHAIKQS